jgi:glutamate-ammonia-ligase adenylyltransferase
MQRLLEKIRFRNPSRASGTIARLTHAISPEVQTGIRSLLAASPDPDEALLMLGRLQEERREAFDRLTASVAGLPFLITVFSHSRFLSGAVLKNPEWLEELIRSDDMDRVLSAEEYGERLEKLLDWEEFLDPDQSGVPSPHTLALFRRRQLLRILIRDVQGFCTLPETTEELSNLADAILEVACRRIHGELVRRHGVPRPMEPGGGGEEIGFAVISLGKLGGKELNYSSDIDLMFLYGGSGETDGAAPIANSEFFKKLASKCVELLSAYSAEGRCYRVDLRLRPEGRLGDVCISLDGARNYYQNRARDWELQMLIKARVSAGGRALGRDFLESAEPRIYSSTLDFSAVEAMSATRERMSEKLAAKKGWQAGFDIKLARGGIRDIEFLVQCLQRLHGGREIWVRHGGTMLALFRLRDKALLSDAEYSRLASAYQFLRNLEHRLQFADDRQTHALPSGRDELDVLASQMPAGEIGGAASGETLLRQVNKHLEEVQEIYERVIHAQQPMYYGPAPLGEPGERPPEEPPAFVQEAAASNLIRFLDQKAPKLAQLLSRQDLHRGQRHFEHFLELILPQPDWLGWLENDPVLASRAIDLFEHSSYLAEQLIRSPELLEELRSLGEDRATQTHSPVGGIDELRRFFLREMFRIQSESICLGASIFATLERTSDLADEVIGSACRLAVEQVTVSHPPQSAGYVPGNQMVAIALGRLGMREFDLASDADLVFVLPGQDAVELPFWTRVAERTIELITAYTGQGVMFAVDTRLRPNGREGGLVQLEGAYRDYFARTAEAWEGITYMKSRAVAGDTERATEFLHALQDLDWRRYGQSGRSKKALMQMRARLEKEQGPGNPLKAGRGGYYDIDFALMYLRLKGAGIFFKVLNTPARIDVIEKMGHLDPPDADFLRDAAIFYRAVDHGLRVSTGHTEGDLPVAASQLENLTDLVRRWTPDRLHGQPLDIELAQIQARTREYFNRLFGS